MKQTIQQSIDESIKAKQQISASLVDVIETAAKVIIKKIRNGGKVLIAGNGGSASQASHFAGELVGRYLMERKGIPAISLATDMSVITAWTNDYSYDSVFERQIEALGKKEDVFFGISTSGNSKNIIKALEKAKASGLTTISLLGKDGGPTKGIADIDIIVPNKETPRIQEGHILIIHILCELIENAMGE